MIDYAAYSDRTIRNKETPSEEEDALADMQADHEVASFLERFSKEPKFLRKRLAPKLATKLVEYLSPKED